MKDSFVWTRSKLKDITHLRHTESRSIDHDVTLLDFQFHKKRNEMLCVKEIHSSFDQSIRGFKKSLQSEECLHCDTKSEFTDRAWRSIKSRKAAWSDGRGKEQREWKERGRKLDGEHFFSDDTCVLMAFAELLSATMTNRKNHSSCQPAFKGLCEKTLEAPFS